MKKPNRIPKKPLNKFVKSTLLAILKRDDIKIDVVSRAGSNTHTVSDAKGKVLFVFENAWDYGNYMIEMPTSESKKGNAPAMARVADMEWFENDNNTNPQQQDIFDVFDAMNKKREELEAIEQDRKSLTPEEIMALKAIGMSK